MAQDHVVVHPHVGGFQTARDGFSACARPLGDMLDGQSLKNGVDADSADGRCANPNLIYPGQRIRY